MYSRFQPNFGMGKRYPIENRPPVYVPLNYGGTALGTPPDGVPPTNDGVRPPSDEAVSHSEAPTEASGPAFERGREEAPSEKKARLEANSAETRPASLLSGIFSSRHFPFGHGVGYEELLLLGLILFLMHEGGDSREEDDLSMTLLLLGALLFCG